MEPDSQPSLLSRLEGDPFFQDHPIEAEPLTGGVSSEILKVNHSGRTVVVKQALAQLKVEADWRADLSRNQYEVRYLKYVGLHFPGLVPSLIREGNGFFIMEHIGEGFSLWKPQMLAGSFCMDTARNVGLAAGRVHAHSASDPGLLRQFDSTQNFIELRVSPYLYALRERHGEISEAITQACHQLVDTREALVHGDLSPKNIMVGKGRVVLLDCEVAWYGDPAFDVAFLLTHLLLKGLYRSPDCQGARDCANAFLEGYTKILSDQERLNLDGIMSRATILLPMILLARVDGKSPVEYLNPKQQDQVRRFCLPAISGEGSEMSDLISRWFQYCEAST